FTVPPAPLTHPRALHDALPILGAPCRTRWSACPRRGRSARASPASNSRRGRAHRHPSAAVSMRTLPFGIDGSRGGPALHARAVRSEEHTSELQSRENLVCRLLL